MGFSKDSRLPAEFDISMALSKGGSPHGDDNSRDPNNAIGGSLKPDHELLVLVTRWSDGSYLEVRFALVCTHI